MKDRLFIAIMTAIMLSVMIFAPVTYFLVSVEILAYHDAGNIIEPDKVYVSDSLLSASLNSVEQVKASITDVYTNYLPFYKQIVSNVNTAKINFNKPIYSWYTSLMVRDTAVIDKVNSETINLSEIQETEIETAIETTLHEEPDISEIIKHSANFLKSGLYSIDVEFADGTETGLLTLVNTASESQNRVNIKAQAAEVNRITAADSMVNVYLYVCSRLQDGELFPEYVPGTVSLKPLMNEYFDLLDDRVKYDYLKVNTLEDSISKLYLSDHHWNAYGMYEGYCDIINMISADSPSIGKPRAQGEKYDIPDAVFSGSNARTHGYYNYFDVFYFYDYNLPEHKIITTNPYNGFDVNMEKYLAGKFDKDLNTDHYVLFYPYTEYVKYPESKTGRRLLVLGDSYSRGISELLCSNFDETYIFDFRRIDEIGDYNKFIADKGITDVLFMQYSLRGVFNYYNDNTLTAILTR
ncbi:MAG: hypothetical protein ACYCWE_15595 [Eubacteriales bacterium]